MNKTTQTNMVYGQRPQLLQRKHLWCRTCILSLLLLISGCDGGLFGTGDGSIESIDAAQPPVSVAPESETSEQSAPAQESDNSTEGIESSDISVSLAFDNTMPSGLNTDNVLLPAAKILNLSSIAINAYVDGVEVGNSVNAPQLQSSELLAVNTGESTIVLRSIEDNIIIGSISPLNAAPSSITSIIISSAGDNAALLSELTMSLTALTTRAQATAADMVDLRIVTVGTSDSDNASYTLTPTSTNTQGLELQLSATPARSNNTTLVSEYLIARTGSYTLSSTDTSMPVQTVELEAGRVYTLIDTGQPETPLFIEVDSIEP